MELTLEACQKRMDKFGNLNLCYMEDITSLPEVLDVGGSAYLRGGRLHKSL